MADILAPILQSYTNFTLVNDREKEINSLKYISFENNYPEVSAGSRFVIVLIEPMLINAGGNTSLQNQFINALIRYKADLRAEGLYSRFILADVYKGPIHKDGQTLLAIRDFFKKVQKAYANFEGAVLVGNFPEAALVRKVAWAPIRDITWWPKIVNEEGKEVYQKRKVLGIFPELISTRADIVLSDLNGNWENLYARDGYDSESIEAMPLNENSTNWYYGTGGSVKNCEFTSSDYKIMDGNEVSATGLFTDVFFLNDGWYQIIEKTDNPKKLKIKIYNNEQNNEVHEDDQSCKNIIARPDIAISRINAFHVALNPFSENGQPLLNAAGNPQVVQNTPRLIEEYKEDKYDTFTKKNFDLERKMLISYFQRNHQYRTGSYSNLPFRVGAISGDDTTFNPTDNAAELKKAANDFSTSVVVSMANLHQYVHFLKTPAVLKHIIAHSGSAHSTFAPITNATTYQNECGGAPFRWIYDSAGRSHKPSFDGIGGTADNHTHRTLWHYNALKNYGASIIIHAGCEVNWASYTMTVPYTDPNYARGSNSESILFQTNCVALFSRAKEFNDKGYGFVQGFKKSDRANLGDCWKNFFEEHAKNAQLMPEDNIQRKRPYFWSLIGDWTLRLRNNNGIGIIGFDVSLKSIDVHPNNAWIDGWNYISKDNKITAIGDIDGDGIDEFVITSDWGIGIFKYDGIRFKACLTAPRNTQFGQWKYDSTINQGRDSIKATGKFTQTQKKEILIWSNWGIATLLFNGVTLNSSRIFENSAKLGNWTLNTANNTFAGIGNFDNDGRQDILLRTSSELGIISLNNSRHVYMAANGTRFGEWNYKQTDKIPLIGDFDGDGMDEILITSSWGIGILKMVAGTLTTVALYANGTNLNGYVVKNTDNFCLADKFGATAKEGIILHSTKGMHYLELNNNRLSQITSVENGVIVNGWNINSAKDSLQRAGNMHGENRAEFLIRSPWGIGLFQVNASNKFQCLSLFAYDTMINDWYLQKNDVCIGHGNLYGGTPTKTELLFFK